MAPLIRRRLLVVAVLLPVLAVAALPAAAAAASCKAWLVQSIPTDMPHLRRVPGVLSTGMLPSVFCHIERWREGVTF
jgi:phospholipase D3/4